MKKILIFTQHFYPENFRINEVARTLKIDYGCDVYIVTGKPNYPTGKLFKGYRMCGIFGEWCGIKVFRLPIWLRGSGGRFNLFLNYMSFILSATIYSIFKLSKLKPDVVFCYATSPLLQALPAIFYCKLFKKKLILNVQDLWPESLKATGYIKSHLVLSLVNKVVAWIYKESNLILVQSKSFLKEISTKVPVNKIIYWPNSIIDFYELDSSMSDLTKYKFLSNAEEFVILFAGNIGAAQSITTVLEAAVELKAEKKISFVILGDGSEKKFIQSEILSKCIDNVTLLGTIPPSDMPSFYKRANVLLLTLTSEHIFSLTIPNKLQAYLCSGKPILAAINGEVAQIIRESSSGVVVPAEDSIGLAKAVKELYSTPESELQIMGLNARNYYLDNFSHEKLMSELIEIINDIADI